MISITQHTVVSEMLQVIGSTRYQFLSVEFILNQFIMYLFIFLFNIFGPLTCFTYLQSNRWSIPMPRRQPGDIIHNESISFCQSFWEGSRLLGAYTVTYPRGHWDDIDGSETMDVLRGTMGDFYLKTKTLKSACVMFCTSFTCWYRSSDHRQVKARPRTLCCEQLVWFH